MSGYQALFQTSALLAHVVLPIQCRDVSFLMCYRTRTVIVNTLKILRKTDGIVLNENQKQMEWKKTKQNKTSRIYETEPKAISEQEKSLGSLG